MKAKFQADAAIIGKFINGDSLMAMYGRTLTRWKDAAKAFGLADKIMCEICRQKLHLERRIHGLWPKFVSYQEDYLLRKPKWELTYG